MYSPLESRMLTQIQEWETVNDRRAIFLSCYHLMTTNMLHAVADGRFHNSAWVTTLIHRFADYYFVALDAYEGRAGFLPSVWHHTHDLAREPTTTVVQNLLMGVNAHINCDLALVLDDLLSPVWADLDAATRTAHYEDYCLVNTIIGETIDTVQDRVVERYARMMNIVDMVLGPLDEWCTARLIRNWRDEVWQRAELLFTAGDDAVRAALREETDVLAVQRIRLLMDGGALGARVFGYPLRYLHRWRLL